MKRLQEIGFCILVLIAARHLSAQTIPSTASVRAYDVVKNYGASGSAVTTTGTITASTNTLIVASTSSFLAGQGIFVAGAVSSAASNPAGNLITLITGVSGNTITLAANATVGVTNALVQHDDTVAINDAIAAAFNNNGGVVWFPTTGVDGIYRCSAVANTITGGVLTFPQNLVYINVPTVQLMGEVEGQTNNNGLSLNPGGVGLDFSNAPNVAGNAAISTAPFVAAGSGNYASIFEPVNVMVDNMIIFLPASTKIHGLLFSNAMQASVGDRVSVLPKADASGIWNQPQTGSIAGVWMPQAYNNVFNNVGSAGIFSMNHCLVAGDHLRLARPDLTTCNVPLWINGGFDVVAGTVTIENSPLMVEMNPSPNNGNQPLDITIDAESWGSGWAARGTYDIVDTNQQLTGIVRYKLYGAPGGFPSLNINGAGNLNFMNLEQPPAYVSGITGCGTLGAASVSQFNSEIVGTITGAPTGSCPAVLTFTQSFTNGWSCWVNNRTHPGATNTVTQASSTGTTATFQGTTISGDALNFGCTPIAGHP